MRAVQLLAAGMFCLLIPGLGCGRTVSKVGEYSEQAAIHGGGSAGESFGNGKGNDYAGSGGLATMHGDAGAGGSTMPIASTDGKCTFKSLNAPRHPLDMYVMMDSNITLAVGLWDLTAQGLRMFADDPRSNGLNVGVRYYGTECNASAYEMETVPIDVLPNNAPAIDSSTMQLPLRASQMLPALSGAISHQKKRAPLHPGAKQIVVLITDGITQDFNIVCPPYGVPDLTAAARAGFDNAPSIETYLLTLSTTVPGADLAARFGMLDQVAAAGGTGSAIKIAANGVAASLDESMQQVRRRAQPCEYMLDGLGADTSRVSLALADTGGTSGMELYRVSDVKSCGTQDGWYFDDAATPHAMVLCPTTCAALRTDDSQTVLPLTGCAPATR